MSSPQFCTKVKYDSAGEARKALTRLLRIRAVQGEVDRMEQRAYPCQQCAGAWHLTSMSWSGR